MNNFNNFKTSYVTVNRKKRGRKGTGERDFKTSYVTVNHREYKGNLQGNQISKHLMLRLILNA